MSQTLETTVHTTPNGSVWLLEINEDGTFKAKDRAGFNPDRASNKGRSFKQFLADLDRAFPTNSNAPKPESQEPVEEEQHLGQKTPYRIPPTGAIIDRSTGDWQLDQKRFYLKENELDPNSPTKEPYCRSFIPAKDEYTPGYFVGPEDAFLWFGLPYIGDPWISSVPDPSNPKNVIPIEPRLDMTKISKLMPDGIIGDKVWRWVAWDEKTRCNVFEEVK
jgi:hypothetical protein